MAPGGSTYRRARGRRTGTRSDGRARAATGRARRRRNRPETRRGTRRARQAQSAPAGAATLAVELGRPNAVVPLLRELNQLDLGDLERARVTWLEEVAVTRPLGDAGRIPALVAAAERAGAAGDHELHVDLLWLVASRTWWVDPGAETRQVLIDAAGRLGDASAKDPRVFAIHAYADPLGHAADVLSAPTERGEGRAARRLRG